MIYNEINLIIHSQVNYKLCILLPIHVYLKIQMLFFLCKDNKIKQITCVGYTVKPIHLFVITYSLVQSRFRMKLQSAIEEHF